MTAGSLGKTAGSKITMYYEIVRASGGFRAHIEGGNNELMFWTEVYDRT